MVADIYALVNNIYRAVHDSCPDGKKLVLEMAENRNLGYVLNDDMEVPACFVAYANHSKHWVVGNHPGDSVDGAMFFSSRLIAQGPGRVAESMVHEAQHVLQNDAAACLHARYNNLRSRIILHPYDDLLVEEVAERDAYAMQAFLSYKIKKKLPDIGGHVGSKRVIEAYSRAKKSTSGNVGTVLAKTSQYIMYNSNVGNVRALDHYHAYTLDGYGSAPALLAPQIQEWGLPFDAEDLIYVRVDEEDLAEIPSGFGPNFMKSNAQKKLAPLGQMSDENRAKMEGIIKERNIPERESLPLLRDVLAANGISKRQFIEGSMNRSVQGIPSGNRVFMDFVRLPEPEAGNAPEV